MMGRGTGAGWNDVAVEKGVGIARATPWQDEVVAGAPTRSARRAVLSTAMLDRKSVV